MRNCLNIFHNTYYMKNHPYNLRPRVQIKKTEKFSVLEKIPYKLYEVYINFDEAHDEWTKNKIKGKIKQNGGDFSNHEELVNMLIKEGTITDDRMIEIMKKEPVVVQTG